MTNGKDVWYTKVYKERTSMQPFTDFVKQTDEDMQRIALRDYLAAFSSKPFKLGELIEIFQNGGAWEAVEKLCRVSVRDLIVDLPDWLKETPNKRGRPARADVAKKPRKPMSAQKLAHTPSAERIVNWVKQHPSQNPRQICHGAGINRGYWQQLIAALIATKRLTRARIGITHIYNVA